MKKILLFFLLLSMYCGCTQKNKPAKKPTHFREIDMQTYPEIIGKRPIADSIIQHANQYYQFFYDENDQVTKIIRKFNSRFHESEPDSITIAYPDSKEIRSFFYCDKERNFSDTIEIAFDSLGRQIRRDNYKIFYDTKGRISSMVSDRDQHIFYRYSSKGYLLEYENIFPNGLLEKYRYDEKGNKLEQITIPDGDIKRRRIAKFKYDSNNNCIEKISLDADNHIVKYGNTEAVFTLKYDKYGNCIEQSAIDIFTSFDKTIIRYKYDENGNTTEISFYNTENQLKKEDWNEKRTWKNFYCRKIAIIKRKYNDTKQLIEESFYDENSKLAESDGSNVALIKYLYDKQGEMAGIICFDKTYKQVSIEKSLIIQ